MSVPGIASPAADRLYCPPPLRHLLEKQRRPPPAAAEQPSKPAGELRPDPPPPAVEEAAPTTNLESFIASTAVRVPARRHPRTTSHGSGAGAAYYDLADLWAAFGEWSAYGAGVPLLLNGTDGVVQYYVPSLSAIQLYASSPLPATARKRGLDHDSDRDSSLNTSSQSGNERFIGITTHCLEDDICADRNCFSSDNSEPGNQESCPVFQYMEHDAPHGRQPLADMISVFANKFPDLKTYRSCDLQPSSWISVAWYPIYRIPIGPTLQDLNTCFLTFHSLSTEPNGFQSLLVRYYSVLVQFCEAPTSASVCWFIQRTS